eukprot:IDg19952t1
MNDLKSRLANVPYKPDGLDVDLLFNNLDEGTISKTRMSGKTIIDEPVLVQDRRHVEYDHVPKRKAVDFWVHRYHAGDNVVVNHDGKEWFAVIKEIFMCPVKNIPMFRGTWFWTAKDISDYASGTLKVSSEAADEKHELILGEDRDINRVDTIERRAI